MNLVKIRKGVKVWVDFIDAKILVRHVPRDEFKGLTDQATTRKLVNGEMQPEFDNGLFNTLLCKTAVVDWAGFWQDEDNSIPAPCTPENIEEAANLSAQFVNAVRGVCTDLEKLLALEQEQQRKNL